MLGSALGSNSQARHGKKKKKDQKKVLSHYIDSKYTMHLVLFLSLTNVAEKSSKEQRSGSILFLRTEESLQAIMKLQ